MKSTDNQKLSFLLAAVLLCGSAVPPKGFYSIFCNSLTFGVHAA